MNVSRVIEALSPQAAVDALVAWLQPIGTETIDAADAFGRVLAQRVVCDRPSPAADVSAMDGYAVRHADLSRTTTLAVCGEVRIGVKPLRLSSGKALRIVTGAGIPPGADTVIRREDTLEFPDRIVLSGAHPTRGEHIRRCGENAQAGQEAVASGTLITPPVAAALATFGCARPIVHRRIRLGVIVTGDEIKAADADLTPWQLRDSNGPAVAAMFRDCRRIDAVQMRRAADDPEELRRVCRELLDTCTAVVLTGGVSMGARDFVPGVLRALGSQIVFSGVRQRPGKPTLGAVGPEGQAILGLPGNPVAVLVTARRIVAPVLSHVAGMSAEPCLAAVAIDSEGEAPVDAWSHRPVRMTAPGRGALIALRGSGDVFAAASAHGFVEIPPNECGEGPWPYYEWMR